VVPLEQVEHAGLTLYVVIGKSMVTHNHSKAKRKSRQRGQIAAEVIKLWDQVATICDLHQLVLVRAQ
jgi:hypothetical protein